MRLWRIAKADFSAPAPLSVEMTEVVWAVSVEMTVVWCVGWAGSPSSRPERQLYRRVVERSVVLSRRDQVGALCAPTLSR